MCSYLRLQLWLSFVGSLTYTILAPLVMKWHGVYWTTTMISIYMLSTRLSGFVTPYFRNLSLLVGTVMWVFIDLGYFGITTLYFLSIEWYLLADAILLFFTLVFHSVFLVNFNAFCVTKYGEETFKDYSYTLHRVSSVSGIITFSSVIVLEHFKTPVEYYFYIYWCGLVCCLALQSYNLYKHWTLLYNEHNKQ